jgi:hypothetical protein
MKTPARVGILCVAISAVAQAAVPQESDKSTSSASVEHVRAAIQSSPSITDHSLFTPPRDSLRIGPLTFVPTQTPGQFLAVSVPIGAFASRTAHAFTVARQQRAEDVARREVAQVVAELKKAQVK